MQEIRRLTGNLYRNGRSGGFGALQAPATKISRIRNGLLIGIGRPFVILGKTWERDQIFCPFLQPSGIFPSNRQVHIRSKSLSPVTPITANIAETGSKIDAQELYLRC